MIRNHRLLAIGFIVFCLVSLFIIAIQPEQKKSQEITYYSGVKYELGEKVKVQVYGSSWYDGEITGISSDDQYIVKFCGSIGWFDKWDCGESEVKRSSLAKVKQ